MQTLTKPQLRFQRPLQALHARTDEFDRNYSGKSVKSKRLSGSGSGLIPCCSFSAERFQAAVHATKHHGNDEDQPEGYFGVPVLAFPFVPDKFNEGLSPFAQFA